jgi:hypothetical protein
MDDVYIVYSDDENDSDRPSNDNLNNVSNDNLNDVNLNVYNTYDIGGLEASDDVGDSANRFRFMLRDSIIDWGTFMQIHGSQPDYDLLLNEVSKLLDIKKTSSIRHSFIEVLSTLYKLPVEYHLQCMLKQYLIFETRSLSIFKLFNLIKHHFEHVVETFFKVRNSYIEEKKLSDKLNNFDELVQYWTEMNNAYNYETSSVVLFFLNPPDNIKSKIHWSISDHENEITSLKSKIQQYKYPGFCPKVAAERLATLLKFPVEEFVSLTSMLDPSTEFPNYTELKNKIAEIIKDHPQKPVIDIDLDIESSTDELKESLAEYNALDELKEKTDEQTKREKYLRTAIIRWYVDKIFHIRKLLVPYGTKYEKYYEQNARIIDKIYAIAKEYL